MAKQYRLSADGTLTVSEDTGNDSRGAPTSRTWTIPAEQIKPHVDGEAKAGGAFADMSAGEKSAALDAYNQRKAQAEQDAKNR